MLLLYVCYVRKKHIEKHLDLIIFHAIGSYTFSVRLTTLVEQQQTMSPNFQTKGEYHLHYFAASTVKIID